MDDQAIVTHPFDREEEVSVEQLFTSFCNHLTLGQWELTRVCLQGLFKKGNQLKKPLNEILRAIIDQPHHARLAHELIGRTRTRQPSYVVSRHFYAKRSGSLSLFCKGSKAKSLLCRSYINA